MSLLDPSLPRLDATWTGARRPLPTADSHQVAWVEEETGEIRGLLLVRPEAGPEAFWDALLQAVGEPRQGEPALPTRLVVEEVEVQAHLQALLEGLEIPVDLSDEASLAGEALQVAGRRLAHAAGYLGREDADPASVGAFFGIAARWAVLEPWMALEDSDLLILEGLEESPLVASVMGAGSPDQGLALFSSLEHLQAFLEDPGSGGEGHVRLFLQYAGPETAGPVVQAEIAEHGWPVAAPDAVPVASCPGDPLPFAGPRDLELLGRAMEAVERYLEEEFPALPQVQREPLRLADGTELRVTSLRLSAPAPDPLRKGPRPGRNDPCWCGSGRKYKKCHLDHDREAGRA